MSTPIILSHVSSVDGDLWEVSGTDETHIVAHDWDGWMCTCPDHYYRKSFCKHMQVCADSESIDGHTSEGVAING